MNKGYLLTISHRDKEGNQDMTTDDLLEPETIEEAIETIGRYGFIPRVLNATTVGTLIGADKRDAYQDNEWLIPYSLLPPQFPKDGGEYWLTLEGPVDRSPHGAPIGRTRHKSTYDRAGDATEELATDLVKAMYAVQQGSANKLHPEVDGLNHDEVVEELTSFMRLLFDAYTTRQNSSVGLTTRWYIDSILKGADAYAVALYG